MKNGYNYAYSDFCVGKLCAPCNATDLTALCQMPSVVVGTVVDREEHTLLFSDYRCPLFSGSLTFVQLLETAHTISAYSTRPTRGPAVPWCQVPFAAVVAIIGGHAATILRIGIIRSLLRLHLRAVLHQRFAIPLAVTCFASAVHSSFRFFFMFFDR